MTWDGRSRTFDMSPSVVATIEAHAVPSPSDVLARLVTVHASCYHRTLFLAGKSTIYGILAITALAHVTDRTVRGTDHPPTVG
ncbi:hypothetical protein OH77DRAFT_1011546 [Trametes cingulata]|nr:hypothetical protein OH77DRAFT_1011546 [Trametes cingulata]